MAEELSKTGTWIDTKTGKIVNKQPEEGMVLVAPGGVLTPDVKALIERAADNPFTTAANSQEPVEVATDDEPAVSAKTVTTAKAK